MNHNKFLKLAQDAGIEFSAVIEGRGLCSIPPAHLKDFISNPSKFARKFHGLTKRQWASFKAGEHLTDGGEFRCCAITRLEARCLNPVRGGFECGSDPGRYIDAVHEQSVCPVHQSANHVRTVGVVFDGVKK